MRRARWWLALGAAAMLGGCAAEAYYPDDYGYVAGPEVAEPYYYGYGGGYYAPYYGGVFVGPGHEHWEHERHEAREHAFRGFGHEHFEHAPAPTYGRVGPPGGYRGAPGGGYRGGPPPGGHGGHH